ncbi:cystine ABC transporter substrate-binding protein [Burkholderia gladioli]|uniref:transporter substrate-binding domain-containing protein n=1 Tax=Burkholderia gladioli TaxID=28095 RepID=UPI001364DE89|nr:transporter substrate-binding domain-containing protein [Burkholderia gladioli]KAF1057928.1 L-cystine-binding protein FliY [Burkholderia gladioli]WAG22154.1 cystine ABC transporter substrate-binding protein [Burkholderia gladioli]
MKISKPMFKLACIAAWFGVAAGTAQAADLLDTVKQAGVLKIAMEGTYPPFDSRDASGKLVGFDVDVAKAVAARLGVKPEFIATEWSGILAGLQAGKYDVIVNEVTITPPRKQALDFSQPYVYSAAQLIQRANDDRRFGSLAEFKGDKKLGVTLGTNYDAMARAVPGINAQTYPGAPEKLSDLVNRRIDATLDDRLMVPYLLKTTQLPLRAGAVVPGGGQEMGIPFRKGNPKFAKALDDAISAMKQDGTLRKISMQWFGVDTSVPAAN